MIGCLVLLLLNQPRRQMCPTVCLIVSDKRWLTQPMAPGYRLFFPAIFCRLTALKTSGSFFLPAKPLIFNAEE
jgi:hypothetical protein